MNDPHVESLHYELVPRSDLIIEDSESLIVRQPSFDAEPKELRLHCRMKDHFATADEAREVMEPFLRSWETYAWLTTMERSHSSL